MTLRGLTMSDTYQDKYDHGFREGRAQGITEGKAEGDMSRLIRDVTSIVHEFGIPIEKAMSILGVPKNQIEFVGREVSKILEKDQ